MRMTSLTDLRIAELPERLRAQAMSAQKEADRSFAASQLAQLRHAANNRPARIFTGRVFNGRRGRRGQRVILPSGRVGVLCRALRGVALVQWRNDFALRPEEHVVVSTAELKPFKLAAAVILGRAKSGVRERRSPTKARSSRRNGSLPPRPGSRRRGRPSRPLVDSTPQCKAGEPEALHLPW